MTYEAKRRAFAIGVLVFAVWPLLHRGLVARYDVSPWRFFGWAMYCQPKLPLYVDVYVDRDGVLISLEDTAIVEPELRRERIRYARRRAIWGALLPPDGLAFHVLDAVPEAETVEVAVGRLTLDPSTSHITERRQTYRYRRHPTGE